MKFIKIDSLQPIVDDLSRELNKILQHGGKALWLLSGGSAVDIAVKVRDTLPVTKGLTVMQVDERFGPVEHRDSNWQKLLEAGFNTKGIDCQPVLQNGLPPDKTAKNYEKKLADELAKAHFAVGLFGIGADGHTAGILPGSPAVDSPKLVESYEAKDFKRITITPAAIAKLDLAFVYVVGEEKREVLENLQKDLPVSEQPAQALKLAKAAYVYNEWVEG